MGILIGLANLLLYCAIVIFVAYCIVWLIQGFMGWPIPANVYKWGQIIVGLLCIIAVLIFLAGLLGFGGGFPNYFFGQHYPAGYQR